MNSLKNQNIVILFAFIILSYLLFSHSLFFDFFIFDDKDNIFQNPIILNLNWKNFLWPWQNSLTPLIFNVWQFIALLAGIDSPAPFRFFNIIVHGINSYLVFSLSSKICEIFDVTLEKKYLYFCTFIFLVHPVIVESVIWPSSLRTLLAALFSLTFFHLFLKNDFKLTYAAIFAFVASVLINPVSTGIIFVILVFPLVSKKPIPQMDFIALITFLLIFFSLHYAQTISREFFSLVSYQDRFVLFVSALIKYIEICLLPFSLSFNYNINPANPSLFDLKLLLLKLTLILIFITIPYLILKKKNYTFILCLQLCFFFFISTNVGIYLHDFNSVSIVANRYVYLALFPLMLLLVFLTRQLLFFAPRFNSPLLAIGISCLFIKITIMETLLWKSPEKLFAVAMKATGETQEMLIAKGAVFLKNEKFTLAESVFLRAIDRYPFSFEPLLHLSELYLRTEDRKKIKPFLDRNSIKNRPLPANTFLTFARLYLLINDTHEASRFLNKYIDIYGLTEDAKKIQMEISNQ